MTLNFVESSIYIKQSTINNNKKKQLKILYRTAVDNRNKQNLTEMQLYDRKKPAVSSGINQLSCANCIEFS